MAKEIEIVLPIDIGCHQSDLLAQFLTFAHGLIIMMKKMEKEKAYDYTIDNKRISNNTENAKSEYLKEFKKR